MNIPINPHPEIKGRLLPHPEVIEAQLLDTEAEVRRLRARVADLERMLAVSKSALEKARPVLGYHEHEPWRNEMDKQTGYAASAVRNALDRLNGLFV